MGRVRSRFAFTHDPVNFRWQAVASDIEIVSSSEKKSVIRYAFGR